MLDINPLSDILVNMFSHSLGCLFILLMVSFAVQKPFSLMQFHLFLFSFVFLDWGDQKKYCYQQCLRFYCLFSSSSFMVFGPTFRSLIHFEFILVCGIRRWSSFIFLQISVQFSQHNLLNKLSLDHCICLLPLSNIDHRGVDLFLGSLFSSIDVCVCFYVSTMLF